MTPAITVLMPIYNCAPYLEEAIRSTLRQSFKDFELLLIDDGSTDDTDKIVHTFNDARINFHRRSHYGLVSQ